MNTSEEVPDLRMAKRIWEGMALSESRVMLMRELTDMGLGVAEVEEFNLGIRDKYRSEKLRKGGGHP